MKIENPDIVIQDCIDHKLHNGFGDGLKFIDKPYLLIKYIYPFRIRKFYKQKVKPITNII